ncbi:MAG: hypothetical protein WAM14_01710 [Candidatus Nitrosopolaris sp.]
MQQYIYRLKVEIYDIHRRQEITQFLDIKIKSVDIDPDKRWITTWNDYLNDIKCFLRWLFNEKMKKGTEREDDTYLGQIGKLLPFSESKQRREKELVHIWRQNYGNVMSSSL